MLNNSPPHRVYSFFSLDGVMALNGDLYDSITVSVMEEEKDDDEAAADATAGALFQANSTTTHNSGSKWSQVNCGNPDWWEWDYVEPCCCCCLSSSSTTILFPWYSCSHQLRSLIFSTES